MNATFRLVIKERKINVILYNLAGINLPFAFLTFIEISCSSNKFIPFLDKLQMCERGLLQLFSAFFGLFFLSSVLSLVMTLDLAYRLQGSGIR